MNILSLPNATAAVMLVVYNQSSQDVWLYDGTLTQGHFSDSHDAVPKGYSYTTVAINVSVYVHVF